MGSSCDSQTNQNLMMTILLILLSLNTVSSLSAPRSFSDGPKEVPLLQSLRLLLGLRSFTPLSSKAHHHHHHSMSPSPSPSPSPSLPPMSHLHVERKPRPERHAFQPPRRKDEKGRREVLIAVLVPIGGLIVMSGVAFLIVARKNKKPPWFSNRVSSRRMSLNPGLDLYYLDSFGSDLEKQQAPTCLKQTSETVDESAEITSVNGELTASPRHELVPVEDSPVSDDDDDQSFHSLVESNSSNAVRLSNASVGSFSDAMENFNSAELNPNVQTPVPESPAHENEVKSEAERLPRPPPPPPPPPPPRVSFVLPSRLSNSSTRNDDSTGKALQLNEHFATSPGTVPPPPCPPPLFKTPPPPPLHRTSPTGKDGIPLPKLKPLHWDKLRAAPNQSMVWDRLRSSSFELDEEMIESLFGYNLQQNSTKSDEAKSKTPSPSKHVLEPKRLQNITILSKALNVSSEQVCEAMLQGKGLSQQQLEALVKMAPTEEEEKKLCGFRGELGSAEKFLQAVLAVPFAFRRLQAMLFAESFDEEVLHLESSFSMLEEACKELRSSRVFVKVLEAVLKTGNRMNVGTMRGGARAFKLDGLLKLADVKGTDGKTSLLHFVVQEMGLDLPSSLASELSHVKRAAALDLPALLASFSNLSDGLAHLRPLLVTASGSAGFCASMASFLACAEDTLARLKRDQDRVMSRVAHISHYFHGNVGKEEAEPLRIFVILRDFLHMLDHVSKQLRTSNNSLASFT